MMDSWPRIHRCLAAAIAACLALVSHRACAQSFDYQSKPRAGASDLSYSNSDPAPRIMPAAEGIDYPREGDYLPLRRDANSAPGGFNASALRFRGDAFPVERTAGLEPIPAGGNSGFVVQSPSLGGSIEPLADPMINAGPVVGQVYSGEPCMVGQQFADVDYCAPQQVGPVTKLEAWFGETWLGNPTLWQNFNELSGVQGFKGPVDQGVNGNFGFHKGANWAVPLWDRIGLGYQLGGVIAVSDLSGSAGPVNSTREQYFVTNGLFRRARCNSGLQGGAAIDYLHDNFYTRLNLLQVRAEASYVWHSNEVGLWSAVHLRSNTQTPPAWFNQSTVTWQTTDQFNLFYRYTFANGGVARTWIGLSGVGDLIFGSDATAPLSERWAIQAIYNYLIPRADPSLPNAIKETWGVTVSLVWYPGYRVPNACFNPYRPLFMVADNGSFMIREK